MKSPIRQQVGSIWQREQKVKLPIHSVSMTALKVWNISILERVSQYHYFRITLVYNNFFVVSTTEIWEHHDLS